MISNVGSVVGSTANTKLALGMLSPIFLINKRNMAKTLSAHG